MGFLEVGVPCTWEESKEYLEYVRAHGVEQFLNLYNAIKDRKEDKLRWGDELEYHVLRLDPHSRSPKLLIRAPEVLKALQEDEESAKAGVKWLPEYGAWMIESACVLGEGPAYQLTALRACAATPAHPYGGFTDDLHKVESNMRARRLLARRYLREDEALFSVVAVPTMGVGEFTEPPLAAGGPVARSLFFPDGAICPHPRFGTLTANIRTRRGRKVLTQLPLFEDERTTDEVAALAGAAGAVERRLAGGDGGPPLEAGGDDALRALAPLPAEVRPRSIYMDAMGFGMGACCLQVTFQARDVGESRRLYDQLGVLAPVMLALTAASPAWRGFLADTDVRWHVIESACDDRTPAERGVDDPGYAAAAGVDEAAGARAGVGAAPLRKSRYASIDSFLADDAKARGAYNDLHVEVHEPSLRRLRDAGIDERLATHVAHLFARDPLVVFRERVRVDDGSHTDHFENFQSTNWQSVRWKPPPPFMLAAGEADAHIGWRVELRTMEIQPTDFENAAFTVLVALVSRVVLFFDLNLYVPMSRVDDNMATAHRRDAVREHKFWFRRHIVPLEEQCGPSEAKAGAAAEDEDACDLMSVEEILMGRGDAFPGLVPLVFAYLDLIECDAATRMLVNSYLGFVVARARGEVKTPARWMRDFVREHPEYGRDSVVTPAIAHDMLSRLRDIAEGRVHDPTLLGENRISPLDEAGRHRAPGKRRVRLRGSSFSAELESSKDCDIIRTLVERYALKGNFESTPAFLSGVRLAAEGGEDSDDDDDDDDDERGAGEDDEEEEGEEEEEEEEKEVGGA